MKQQLYFSSERAYMLLQCNYDVYQNKMTWIADELNQLLPKDLQITECNKWKLYETYARYRYILQFATCENQSIKNEELNKVAPVIMDAWNKVYERLERK